MNFPFKIPLILDGDYKTSLLKCLDDKNQFEKLILENPQEFFSLQAEFIKSGSQVISTPTFFCNKPKLESLDFQGAVEEINFNLAKKSKEIAGKDILVGGIISKTGLQVQPFGETTFTELIDIYYNQALALSKGGVDFFLIYDMDNLTEIRAAIFACKKIDIPIFLTINIKEQDLHIKKEIIISYLISTQDLGISAFGLNGDLEIEEIDNIFKEIRNYSKIPIIVKPNAGKQNPILPNLYDLSPKHMLNIMDNLLEYGVYIFGGDLGTTRNHIEELAINLKDKKINCKNFEKYQNSENLVLASQNQVFVLKGDMLEFSQEIECSLDMSDKFLEMEQQSDDVITIELISPDDSILFGLNQHMTKLPICFLSDNEIALKTALMLFNGKALVDKNSSLKQETLLDICKKYGAILY